MVLDDDDDDDDDEDDDDDDNDHEAMPETKHKINAQHRIVYSEF